MKTEIAIIISDKIDFKTKKNSEKYKEGHCTTIKEPIQEDIPF